MKKIIMALFILLAIEGIFSFAQISTAVETDAEYHVSKTWQYQGYKVDRINSPVGASSTLVQMENVEFLTSQGYLPLGDKKTLELFIYDSYSHSLRATGYQLPYAMRCYECATSLSTGAYPMAEVLRMAILL